GRLGVRGDVALDEDGRAVGVEAGREEHRGQVERRGAEVVGVVADGDRVEVDEAEEGLVRLRLRRRVLPKAPAVVAEVLRACRWDAAEDAHGRDSVVEKRTGTGERAGGLSTR